MEKKNLPSTSLDAFKRAKDDELMQKHHDLIIEALQALEFGTYEEISYSVGLEKHQVGRRLSELERENKIYKSGIKRPTASGRSAFCYTLTSAPAKKEVEKINRRRNNIPSIQQTLL